MSLACARGSDSCLLALRVALADTRGQDNEWTWSWDSPKTVVGGIMSPMNVMYRYLIPLLAITLIFSVGCNRHPKTPATGQQSTVISEGTTPPNPGYYTNEKGEVIYTGPRTADEGQHNPAFPEIYPGSNRVWPAKDDPKARESYLIHADLQAIEDFYTNYLDIRKSDPSQSGGLTDKQGLVQSIDYRDKEGKRQAAMFVNKGEGPRGGMKVMLKEYPEQQAVQIILTDVDSTPPGINPIGQYVSPEEVQEWAKEKAAQDEEKKREREQAEQQAQQGSTSN